MASKSTGLGSLLLKRTENDAASESKPPAVETSKRPDVQAAQDRSSAEIKSDSSSTEQNNSAAKQEADRPQTARDRCTLYLDADLNRQLHIAAKLEGKERSEIVSEILRQHLPVYEAIKRS